jgi:transglutaminase-like putative cysteine protease
MRTVQTATDRVYLAPGEYVDSDHPSIRAKSEELCGGGKSDADKASAVFYFVREVLYHAVDFADLNSFRASCVLAAGHGYCGAKASLFAALCRAAGLPTRLLFADVTNHISTPQAREKFGTNLYAWHGYNEVLVDGRWLKVSPTFNSSMCRKIGVTPLEFDGASDAILQAYDDSGHEFMRYEKLHGVFHDVPAKFLSSEMQRLYPEVCDAIRAGGFPLPADFKPPGAAGEA